MDQSLRDAFAKLSNLLDEAANKAENESSRQLVLWKAAAEAEYLAFRISLANDLPELEPNTNVAAVEVSVQRARGLIRDAQATMLSDPRQSYGAIRSAVTILRRMYHETTKISRAEQVTK